jgi:rhodanese-related sulfurtransferase
VPTTIARDDVVRLVAEGAQLVEVLPRAEYDEEHLPDAVHLPLKSLSASTAEGVVDRDRPIIVYCWDALCDMSPRAAWQLEHLGYRPVYDYAVGKVDWMAGGLSTVRAVGSGERAIDVADTKPRTCAPDQPLTGLADLRPHDAVIVVNEQSIVLGRIDTIPTTFAPTAVAEDVMTPGPATVRAHEPLDALLSRMRAHGTEQVIVTTPEGRLLGVVRGRSKAERPD